MTIPKDTPATYDLQNTLVFCANMLDTIKGEWEEYPNMWTEHDQKVRDSITQILKSRPTIFGSADQAVREAVAWAYKYNPPSSPEVRHLAVLIQAAEEVQNLRLHLGEANTLSDQNHALRQRVGVLEGALDVLLHECDAMITEGKLSQLTFAREKARDALNNS